MKCPPALAASGALQSPFSWIWKPCGPGGSPLTLASTRTRSPVGVKPTLPAARLPAVAASFAEALGNECVIDAQPASIDAATMEATQRVITDLRMMSLLCRGPIVARVRCSAKCTEFPPLPLVGNMWDGSHRPPIFASIREPRASNLPIRPARIRAGSSAGRETNPIRCILQNHAPVTFTNH